MDAAAQVHAAFVPLRRADVGAGGSEVALSAWCPTMDLCAAVTSDGQLAVHRMNWQRLWSLAPDAPVTALAWRPDGKLLATGHKDGSLSVWDVETGRAVARHARAHFAPIAALDWSATPASARVDHDDDRWAAAGAAAGRTSSIVDGGPAGTSGVGAAAAWSAAASSATAAEYEDRQARLFPADGLVMLSGGGTAAAGAGPAAKEDAYAELFRGAPPPPQQAPSGAGRADPASARAGGGTYAADPALAAWDVEVVGKSASSFTPLDMLCAADRRGCLTCWVAAGRVQVGDVAGLAAAAPPAAALLGEDEQEEEEEQEEAAPSQPPPPPTLVALSTTLDQSACVSVAWHAPPPPLPLPQALDDPPASSSTSTHRRRRAAAGLLAAPMLARPLRAARREVRHWARLHWRLETLLASAACALRAAEREWGSAASTLRKRLLDELGESLAAHGDGDGGGIGGGDNPEQQRDQGEQADDPRADLLLLLATGSAGSGVHAWLTGSLGEAGVQRVARAVDAALERAHALLLHSCLPALERAAFCLGELRGLAAACCPRDVPFGAGGEQQSGGRGGAAVGGGAAPATTAFGGGGRGALLGLRPEALEPLEAAAVRAVVRAEQVRLALGGLAASYRALFTWLLRTARQLETAAGGAGGADGADTNLYHTPPEPPTGPDAALADVLLPLLEDGGPLATDPLGPELGQRDSPLDEAQQRAAGRWLHSGGVADAGAARQLGPEEVVSRVLRMLYPPERAQQQLSAAGEEGGGRGSAGLPALSLAGQVSALAEACEEALAAPQASVSARLTVGRPVRLAPALCFPCGGGEAQQQQAAAATPRVSAAPEGDGDAAADNDDDNDALEQAGNNNVGGDDGPAGDGVVICVVVPAAGLHALAAAAGRAVDGGDADGGDEAAAAADGLLVVRARTASSAEGGSEHALELRLSAVLVRGDPGARVVDAAPYKAGQLAVLSTPARGEEGRAGAGAGLASPPPPPNPVLALLDLSSAPFTPWWAPSAASSSPSSSSSTSALEMCLASGAVARACELAAEGLVRAARMGGFAAAVAPLAVSRARGLALVLSDMQRLAVLDVEADEEGVLQGE
jgi:hypothetical protein